MKHRIIAALTTCLLILPQVALAVDPEANLVPWPQSLSVTGGEMALSGSSRVVYSDASLSDLAQVVAGEVEEVTRLQLATTQGGSPVAGDIHLKLTTDPSITGEEYKVTVASSATAEAENYNAVAMASVTLIQAIAENGGNYGIPAMTVTDAPDAGYRGHMVDLARNYHSIDTLKEVVDMCRLYKIRYLQLHLTDDQAFTFPSTAYPDLAAHGHTYSLEEVNDLADYADARGVTIIPEMDVPGHSNCFVLAMPELFEAIPGKNVLNFADEDVWYALDTIIGEMLAVFDTAPYFHLGADEVNLGGLDSLQEFQDAITTYNVGDIHGLFNYFISYLDDTIKSLGKETIVWEGFDQNKTGAAEMDTDIAVMMFDNYKHPDDYINAGHEVINASWYPLYIVGHDGFGMDSDVIYQWDLKKFGNYSDPYPRRATATYSKDVATTANVPGAQMCSWEMPDGNEIPYARFRIAPFADRVWNPLNPNDFAHFDARFGATDLVLDYILADHQPPTVPGNVSASNGLYEDMVRVGWALSDNYAVKYALYKNTVNNSSTATLLTDTLSKTTTLYEDVDVVGGQTYYYWVKAWNKWGWSGFSAAGTGQVGSTTLASAYEPFGYTADQDVDGQNGGTGFSAAWNEIESNGTVKTVADSLVYPGVPSRGGAMKATCTSDASLTITRTFDDSTGYDMANVWFSFMVKPETVGSGHCFMSLNNGGAIGKAWENGFGIWPNANQQMEQGVTYLAVVRYDCRAGSDNIYLWINPDLAQEPSVDDSDAFKGTDDLGVGNKIGLNIQGHGSGVYVFDEFRVGSSWNEVIGLSDLDPDAPTPNPMTWVTEPALDGDTAATMECSTASHVDGVQYYFEETSGNPGGDDSDWQSGTTYTDTGLQEGYTYTYRVKARNLSGTNETAWSPSGPVSLSLGNLINFDFERETGWVDPVIGVHSGAAVTGDAGDVWNSGEPEFVQSFPGLLDVAGNATSVALDTDGFGSYKSLNADFSSDTPDLNPLMRDYAFVYPGVHGTATISGLDTNVDYVLYLYAVSDSAGQNTTFSVSGSNEGTLPVTSPDLSGPLTEVDDYVVFTGNTGAGTISITVDGNGGYAAWNGFQLELGDTGSGGDPPSAPTLTSPSDTASGVSVFTELQWSTGAGATSYGVYLWETGGSAPVDPTATVTGLSYDPGGLDPLTSYSWFVESINDHGETPSVGTWTFTTGEVPVSPFDILINVDFQKSSVPVFSGAAATGSVGDFWNSTNTESNIFTDLENLTDSAGSPTTVDVIWSDELQSSENPGAIEFGSTGHNDLMEDYAFTAPGQTAMVTISELPANAAYTLYLYGVPDGSTQQTTFTVTGSNEGTQDVTEGNVNDDNGLADPDDYVVFTGNTGASGQIVYTQTGTGSSSGYSGCNGFQLGIDLGTTGTSYATWALDNGASADPNEDSNNNGVLNGLEFFMGGTLASPATMPPLVDNEGTWTWTIPYDPDALADWKFRTSENLVEWTDFVDGDDGIVVLTGPDEIVFTLPAPVAGGKIFAQLVVTTS